jgi:ribonuclease J
VVLVINGETGRVIAGPEVHSRGVTFDEVEPELLEGVRISIEERLAELDPGTPEEWDNSKEHIRLAVRRHINRILGRKPLVQTIVLKV